LRDHIRLRTVTPANAGLRQRLYLIVSDIQGAPPKRCSTRLRVTKVPRTTHGVYGGTDEHYMFGRVFGSASGCEHRSYRSFDSSAIPDGNCGCSGNHNAADGRLRPATRHSVGRTICGARFGARRPPTESTKKRKGQRDAKLGPNGTPRYMVGRTGWGELTQ